MKLEHLLLGVLAMKPSTGYDLKKYMDSHGRFLRSNTQMSQIYRSLAGMEERDWVVHEVEPRPGATDAKTYRLTEDGAVVFLDWLTSPIRATERYEDSELGARIAFAGFMSRGDLLRLVEAELELREGEVARYRFRDRRPDRQPVLPFDSELADQTMEWGHETGATGKDLYLARLRVLRQQLLDAPDAVAVQPATVQEGAR